MEEWGVEEEAAVEEEEEVRMGSGLSGRPWLLSVRVGSSVCARHVSSADREPAGFSDVDEEACAKQTQLSSITTTSNNMIYQHKQHLLLLNHWLLKNLRSTKIRLTHTISTRKIYFIYKIHRLLMF